MLLEYRMQAIILAPGNGEQQMQWHQKFIIVLLAAMISINPLCCWAADVWAVHQESEQWGPIDATVSNKGIHMETTEFSIYFPAPKFDVTVVNRKNKRYLVQPMAAFKAPLTRAQVQKQLHYNIIKGKVDTIDGIKCTQYIAKQSHNNRTFEFWTTNGLGTSEQLNDVVVRFLCQEEIPVGMGLIVRIMRHNSYTGKDKVEHDVATAYQTLTTTSIKPCAQNEVVAKIPAAYKKVESLVDLVAGESGTMGLEDIPMQRSH